MQVCWLCPSRSQIVYLCAQCKTINYNHHNLSECRFQPHRSLWVASVDRLLCCSTSPSRSSITINESATLESSSRCEQCALQPTVGSQEGPLFSQSTAAHLLHGAAFCASTTTSIFAVCNTCAFSIYHYQKEDTTTGSQRIPFSDDSTCSPLINPISFC